MEIGCIKDLNIDKLKGAWKCGEIVLEIRREVISITGLKSQFEEQTKIKYLEEVNFVQISDNLIIKQIFNDSSISISYLDKLYTFKKVM